ncbi:MAG: PEP-CTERM sorting domain-containing protein [Pirellulales bacterium]|nr:PEP-CTERM sorting domain-containing protein [Pirellulales bacterium]
MSRCFWFGVVTIGFFFVQSARAWDAYNNYGPGDTYDPSTSYPIAGTEMEAPFLLSQHIMGARFTAEATGMLAVIRISLHDLFIPGFNQVDVRLHEADMAGNLGPILAAFTRGGLPPQGPMDPPETITSFDPSVVLTTGNLYWIVVAPGDSTTEAAWNWAIGVGGRLADSSDGGLTYTYREGRLPAMRIEVVSIPEPAALFLLASGLIAFMSRRRRAGC